MHILIIGAGDIGFYLAKRLSEEQHDIVMIEADAHKAARASEQLDAFVIEGRQIQPNSPQSSCSRSTSPDEINLPFI